MKKINSLEDIYIYTLEELYDAEKQQLTRYLDLVANIGNHKLQLIISCQKNAIEEKIRRLEAAFEIANIKARNRECEIMDKLLDNLEKIYEKIDDAQVRDAAAVVAMQNINHYKISSYGSMAAFARMLHYDEIAVMLHTTAQEEKVLNEQLSWLALQEINGKANKNIPSNANWSVEESASLLKEMT